MPERMENVKDAENAKRAEFRDAEKKKGCEVIHKGTEAAKHK